MCGRTFGCVGVHTDNAARGLSSYMHLPPPLRGSPLTLPTHLLPLCIPLRCSLGALCHSHFLHSPPCSACFPPPGDEAAPESSVTAAVKKASAAAEKGPSNSTHKLSTALSEDEAHHCDHVCDQHRAWLSEKPEGIKGLRKWQNTDRPRCSDPGCLKAHGACCGSQETAGRYATRATCKTCYLALERAQHSAAQHAASQRGGVKRPAKSTSGSSRSGGSPRGGGRSSSGSGFLAGKGGGSGERGSKGGGGSKVNGSGGSGGSSGGSIVSSDASLLLSLAQCGTTYGGEEGGKKGGEEGVEMDMETNLQQYQP